MIIGIDYIDLYDGLLFHNLEIIIKSHLLNQILLYNINTANIL